jgi:hypothetical protein
MEFGTPMHEKKQQRVALLERNARQTIRVAKEETVMVSHSVICSVSRGSVSRSLADMGA